MHNARGFVGVGALVAIIIGLAVLGGGAYFVTNKKAPVLPPPPIMAPESQSGTPAVAEKSVASIDWHIELASPSITNPDDYKKYEQAIAIDVTFTDKSTKRYDLGTSYGCTGTKKEAMEDGKKVFGQVLCYMAASGVDFVAYQEGTQFIVERIDEDASGRTSGKTSVVLKI